MHKDSLKYNQNYRPYSYQYAYEGKFIVPITANHIKIILKKNQVIFMMSLIIDMEKAGDLTDNFIFLYERRRSRNPI